MRLQHISVLTEPQDIRLASFVLNAAIAGEPTSRTELEQVAGVFEHVVREMQLARVRLRNVRGALDGAL